MRRTVLRALGPVLVTALALAACVSAKERQLAFYYDPQRLFSTRLPAANEIRAVPPEAASGGPRVLSGVISLPPVPSPSPQSPFGGLGSGLAQQVTPSDRTVYEVFAVTTDAFADLDAMAVAVITGDPSVDVRGERAVRMDGLPARLVVADIVRGGETLSSVAVAMTLGERGTGYLLLAIFPPGQWETEEPDFLRVLGSFRTETPPPVWTYPLAP
jgi:hypothetical protein